MAESRSGPARSAIAKASWRIIPLLVKFGARRRIARIMISRGLRAMAMLTLALRARVTGAPRVLPLAATL